ncbi:MAG TPA: type II toxin-antitoxin system prevent-host-death family antitoxin [Burkholderiaceae bacterium]|nr:type II toxin-antitoxin system prevent-host-death family antitoxin [Burkholderiaceae bacterium]
MQVNILEAKNRLSELVRSAQCGEEVIIANRGVPVARLVAVGSLTAAGESTPLEGSIVEWLERNPLPVHVRRSHEAIEADLREERGAWD